MEETNTPDIIKVEKKQLEALVLQNRELKATTHATTDLILIFIQLIGGKLPTTAAQGILLLTKLPGIINGLNETQKDILTETLQTITEHAPKYLRPDQQQQLIDTQIYKLLEK